MGLSTAFVRGCAFAGSSCVLLPLACTWLIVRGADGGASGSWLQWWLRRCVCWFDCMSSAWIVKEPLSFTGVPELHARRCCMYLILLIGLQSSANPKLPNPKHGCFHAFGIHLG